MRRTLYDKVSEGVAIFFAAFFIGLLVLLALAVTL